MGKYTKNEHKLDRESLVSIIIPAYNEEKVIGRLLQSIKTQTYNNIETIVVDDGSTDNTVKIAKLNKVNIYARKHAERSVQRNFGAEVSKGKYLFFLDADMKLTRDVVGDCVYTVKNGKNIGAIVIPEKSVATNFWERVKAFERSFYNLEGDSITDAARFFTRTAFEKAGGYDETITGPEDWDLPDSIRNLGYGISRVESFIYHYERIKSPFTVAQKKYYYAIKSPKYIQKQRIPVIGPKTVYFLRPVFYKEWKRLVKHPILTLGMVFMLTIELIYGGTGFFVGKFLNK